MPSQLLTGAQHLQNLHPLVVHFPIALLFSAALFYFLRWITGRDSWSWTGFWMLVLGTVSAAVAAGTGLYASTGLMIAPSVREHLLVSHMRIMLAVVALSAVLALWAAIARPMPARGRLLFLMLLLVLIGSITIGADYGGRMVFDYNAAGNACPQPIEFAP
jgi:uncharacterized membrane protein